MFKKLKTKEELAIINFGWLIAGLFSFSLVVEYLLAFLIAKQVIVYFQANYPYKRVVKFFTLLNMLLTFLAVFAILMGGAFQFNASGYRLFLGIGAVYWISTFIGVLGLFSVRKNIVIGGITVGAMLSFYLFWMQINPFLETSRSTPKRWAEQSTELVSPRKVNSLQVCVPSFEDVVPLNIYAKAKGISKVSSIEDPASLRAQFQQDKTSVFVLDKNTFQLIRPSITSFTKVDSASTRLEMFSELEMIYFVSGH